MAVDFEAIIEHDGTGECTACIADDVVEQSLLPAAAAWEAAAGLPQFAVALRGAAGLLATMLRSGVSREDIEAALSRLLDEAEQRISEDKMMGGPPEGNA